MPSLTPAALSPVIKADVDRNTVFCLACFSSLPPSKRETVNGNGIFTTPCCRRPICPACISKNPRLLRYNPCLACLGGIGAVSSSPWNLGVRPNVNVDGAVRDEKIFVLDDEDEEEADNGEDEDVPCYQELDVATVKIENGASLSIVEPHESIQDAVPSSPRYYINRNDNLQGICLRYGFNGHELCRLNNLPPSTLTTNPHLLHTRRYLELPRSSGNAGILMKDEEATAEERKAREIKWGKERAEKRLQTLTKEVDWRVAKAYVALAEAEEDDEKEKEKELGVSSNLSERAIRRYLDDNEWESLNIALGKSG